MKLFTFDPLVSQFIQEHWFCIQVSNLTHNCTKVFRVTNPLDDFLVLFFYSPSLLFTRPYVFCFHPAKYQSSSAFLLLSSFCWTPSLVKSTGTMSSANSAHQGTLSLTYAMKLNTSGLRAEPWWKPTFTMNVSAIPTMLFTCMVASVYIYCIALTYFSETPSSLKHLHNSCLGTRSYAFARSINTRFSPVLSPYTSLLSALTQILHQPGIKPNCSSHFVVSVLNIPSITLTYKFIAYDISFIPL